MWQWTITWTITQHFRSWVQWLKKNYSYLMQHVCFGLTSSLALCLLSSFPFLFLCAELNCQSKWFYSPNWPKHAHRGWWGAMVRDTPHWLLGWQMFTNCETLNNRWPSGWWVRAFIHWSKILNRCSVELRCGDSEGHSIWSTKFLYPSNHSVTPRALWIGALVILSSSSLFSGFSCNLLPVCS